MGCYLIERALGEEQRDTIPVPFTAVTSSGTSGRCSALVPYSLCDSVPARNFRGAVSCGLFYFKRVQAFYQLPILWNQLCLFLLCLCIWELEGQTFSCDFFWNPFNGDSFPFMRKTRWLVNREAFISKLLYFLNVFLSNGNICVFPDNLIQVIERDKEDSYSSHILARCSKEKLWITCMGQAQWGFRHAPPCLANGIFLLLLTVCFWYVSISS